MPAVGRKAETVLYAGALGDAAAFEVFEPFPALGGQQHVAEVSCRVAVHREQPRALFGGAVIAFIGHCHARSLGEEFYAFYEVVVMLYHAHEVDNVAARAAAEAVKALAARIYMAGRCALGMERTETDIIPACPLQFDIGRHHRHYVIVGFESI